MEAISEVGNKTKVRSEIGEIYVRFNNTGYSDNRGREGERKVRSETWGNMGGSMIQYL